MPQSLSKALLHVIFSTKNRDRIISKNIQPKLYAYTAGICRKIESQAYRVGGTDNHIHIACSLPRTLTISKLLEEVKKSSSKWLKTQDDTLRTFSWQAGYGAFSLGQSQIDDLLKYIDNQEQHHKIKTYKEEFKDLLHKYNIEYDERYLWD
ncbi:transposase [Candidatus Magnetomorum sp. HK-1]|nr:transposase [Candidatus Magnetomorum sp. HK-1]